MSKWTEHVTSDGYMYYTCDEETTVPYKLDMLKPITGSISMTPREYAEWMKNFGAEGVSSVVRTPPKQDLKPAAPTAHSPKAPMHALPLDRLGGLARALDHGDTKYAVRNWVDTAKDPRLYIGAALRHLAAIQRGEMIDPDSGLPHVNHLQASAVILEEALRNAGLLITEYK